MGSGSPRMINLGCGSRFHPDWVNADIAPRDPSVLRCDLSRPLEFADGSFDVVYHSNVLEHIRRKDALPFMLECHRILKPGGILRVATPDLERIGVLYLEKLRKAAGGDATAACDYDWLLLEMYDQTVREKGGGAMLEYLRRNPLPNEPFIIERIGQEGREMIEALRRSPPPRERSGFAEFIRRPRVAFEWVGGGFLRMFFGADAPRALAVGRFRLAGEVHQWMYDRFSLARLAMEAGFQAPAMRQPAESAIPGWAGFELDNLPDGTAVKPDSLFAEASK